MNDPKGQWMDGWTDRIPMQATAVAAIISIASPVRTCRCCCYWRCLSCDVVAKKDVTCGTCNILCPAKRKKRQTTTTTPVRQKRIRKHTNTLTSVEHILIFQCLPLPTPSSWHMYEVPWSWKNK